MKTNIVHVSFGGPDTKLGARTHVSAQQTEYSIVKFDCRIAPGKSLAEYSVALVAGGRSSDLITKCISISTAPTRCFRRTTRAIRSRAQKNCRCDRSLVVEWLRRWKQFRRKMRRNSRSEEGRTRAHFFAPATRASRLANRASKARLNAPAASALSITIESLFWRLWPNGERFAATVRSNRPSISRLRASHLVRMSIG